MKFKLAIPVALLCAVMAFPVYAGAASYSGTNGWITYAAREGMGPSAVDIAKGVKPSGAEVTLSSTITALPSWSADGSKVAWIDSSMMGGTSIKVSNAAGENAVTVLSSSALSGVGMGFDGGVSLSADGSKITFTRGTCDIYVVAAQPNQTVGSADKVVDGTASTDTCASYPEFSPSGAIAYLASRSCEATGSFNGTVRVLTNPVRGTPADGTALTSASCLAGERIRGGATWSPDGSKLIFSVDVNSAPDKVIRINADNTGRTTLYSTSGSSVAIAPSPVYSPDASKIAFAEGAGNYTIKYMNADGSNVTATSAQSQGSTYPITWGPEVSLTPSGSSGGGSGGSSSTGTPTATTTTTTTTGKPAPGPALKVTDIPAEITLDLGSSTGGAIPADQPIVAEVPCSAPEGQLLDRCTVNVTAPEYVLLGQGDGISVRSDKKVSIGKATVKSKAGKKTIVVKVKINPKGRKALQRNLKITATVGLTAITVSNLKSSGEANTEMRLPTQLISPQSGIFDSNSVSLNKAGVAFVNRLAKLLPSKPKNMVFIGFADNTGVPGDNRWLGDRRAKAVRDALAAKGVEPVKSSIETKAARSPRDDNAKSTGRERNRRVSIRITY